MMEMRSAPWPFVNPFDDSEKRAMARVLRRGELSGFAATVAGFLGGPEVRALEEETCDAFKVRYAVSVNSGTSALICAVGALMLHDSSVAVTPYSMSASVACILPWLLAPEFIDISLDDYMMRRDVKPVSKAAVFVDLFGNLPTEFPDAEYIIEDACQAACATRNGKFAGTFGDIGVLSMNKYKVGGVGEGGMILTDSEEFAFNCQLIRNHGEVVTQEMQVKGMMMKGDPRAQLLGYNFRLPEISAALAREQLKKLPGLIASRQERAVYLAGRLQPIPGLALPYVAPGVKPAWYRYPVRVPAICRASVVDALQARSVPCKAGYVIPIHHQEIHGLHCELPNVEQAEREIVLLNVLGEGAERKHLDDIAEIIANALS